MLEQKHIPTPYRIVPLSRIILLKMYQQHIADDERDRLTVNDVCDLFTVPISKNLTNSALLLMVKSTVQRFVSVIGTASSGNQGYRITQDGIMYIERELRRKTSDISYFAASGDSALADVAGLDGIFWSRDELSDSDDWAPIEFDRSSLEFTEAITAVDAAIDQIEASNEFAALFPEQRDGVLATLRDGLSWLKAKSPTSSQIKAQILSPLIWVSTTFANTALSEIAKKAAQRIVDLISKSFFGS